MTSVGGDDLKLESVNKQLYILKKNTHTTWRLNNEARGTQRERNAHESSENN